MCLQDFQMARRTESVTYNGDGGSVTLPANANRLRIVVAWGNGQFDASGFPDNIGGQTPFWLAGWVDSVNATQLYGTDVLRLEDYGLSLLGGLLFRDVNGTGKLRVTDVTALPDLDRLITNGGK